MRRLQLFQEKVESSSQVCELHIIPVWIQTGLWKQSMLLVQLFDSLWEHLLTRMNFIYLFFKKLIIMITSIQSEIWGFSLGTIIVCCTNAGTLSGWPALSKTVNQPHRSCHSLHSSYTKEQCKLLIVRTGENPPVLLGRGCSSLDWTLLALAFFAVKAEARSFPPGQPHHQERKACLLEYAALATPTRKQLLLQTAICLDGTKL